eukprot:8087104-Ditylum_brightwellii.AAC.1
MVAHLAHTDLVKEHVKIHNHSVLASMPPFSDMKKELVGRQLRTIEYLNCLQKVDDRINEMHPLVFVAKANSANIPNYWQAMNHPNNHMFIEAMKPEMEQIENLDAWELIDEKDVPFTESGVKCTVIESTWAFKVKRTPDGTVKKRKA